MSRWIGFILALIVGIGGGLFYGWAVNPVEYVDTTPDTLRIDYKTDYVLMVAEIYQIENDPALAVRRLALLGNKIPSEVVREAILFAETQGYTDPDVILLRNLNSALQTWNPILETPAP